MKNDRVPHKIYDDEGCEWTYSGKDDEIKHHLVYWSDHYSENLSIPPSGVAALFTIKRRRKPKTEIVVQDKWSCAASALAMVTGEHIFFVKQAMGKCGWRNDEGGASDDVLIGAARLLGKDLIRIPRSEFSHDMGPAIVTVESLNYKGRWHGVAWNGKEILDPNYGRPGRKWWGPEWAPWTMGAPNALILLDKRLPDYERQEIDRLTRKKHSIKVKELRSEIFKQLQSHGD